MDNINVLKDHPELAPDVARVLSSALTSARQRIGELESRLQDQTNAGSCDAAGFTAAENEIATLRSLYDRERDSGRELRAALEERYIRLRTKETAVEELQNVVEKQLEASREKTEALRLEAAAEVAALRKHLSDATAEGLAFQRALDANQLDLSARDEALSALSTANRSLKEKLGIFQEQDSLRSKEVDRLKAAFDAVQVQTAEDAERIEVSEKTIASLRLNLDTATGQAAAHRSKCARLEQEMQTLLARQTALEEEIKSSHLTLEAKGTELRAREAEIHTRDSELRIVRDASAHLRTENSRLARERASAVGVQGGLEQKITALQAELVVVRAKVAKSEEKFDDQVPWDSKGVAAKESDSELRKLDERNSAIIVTLKEELRVATCTVETITSENITLKETAKLRLVQMTELDQGLLALHQRNANLHAKLVRREEAERATLENMKNNYLQLDKAYINLGNQYTAQNMECNALKERLGIQVQYAVPAQQVMVGSLPRPVGNERQPKTERSLYVAYMKTLPVPTDRPDFNSPNLAPIDNIGVNPYTHNIPTSWRTLHCPKRTVWCDVNRRHHALVFAPTHEYSYSSNKWVDKTKMNCGGEQVEFFVNQGKFVYYVGTYVVHSMRTVHRPGSSIASDVSSSAIYRATGLNKEHSEKVAECFPDGAIKTECFGLQCVGFNRELYEGLRERFLRADGGDQKRKAGADDLRGSESAKSQRIA